MVTNVGVTVILPSLKLAIVPLLGNFNAMKNPLVRSLKFDWYPFIFHQECVMTVMLSTFDKGKFLSVILMIELECNMYDTIGLNLRFILTKRQQVI